MRRSFTGPRLAGAALLAGSVAVLAAVTAIPGRGGYEASGPRFVPLIVAIALIALSVLFLARTFVRPDTELAERSAAEDDATHWGTPALLVVALVVYVVVLEDLGYPVATVIFFVGVARLLGSRSLVRDILIGLLLGFGLFTAFTQYLGVSLPAGLTPIF